MPDNLLSFTNDSLTKLDHSIHDKIEGSLIDNFIHELQNHLTKLQSSYLLNSMSQHTILTFANVLIIMTKRSIICHKKILLALNLNLVKF